VDIDKQIGLIEGRLAATERAKQSWMKLGASDETFVQANAAIAADNEILKSLRLVPKLMKVVEAARKVAPWIGHGGVVGHPSSGGYTPLYNALEQLQAALAALDAGEGEK